MNIEHLISILTSVAACLSAIAAFFTVRQVSKQREHSYRPELVIPSIVIDGISSNQEKEFIPLWWSDNLNLNSHNDPKRFQFSINNVGLGAAKEIHLSWSFPIEKIVNDINKLIQQSLIPLYFACEDGVLVAKSKDMVHESISMWKNQKNEILDFILPSGLEKTPALIVFPDAYKRLLSSCIYFSFKTSKFEMLEKFPPLLLTISFKDIGNKEHNINLKVLVDLSLVKENDEGKCVFNGHLVAKRIKA